MKHLKTFAYQNLKEYTEDEVKSLWFDAIWYHATDRVKDYIDQGIDVNMRDEDNNTALFKSTGHSGTPEITMLLLEQPNIDIKVWGDIDFITTYHITYKKELFNKYCGFLKNYKMQKKIIENGRVDIIKCLKKYDLIHLRIKNEYPHLFMGADLNLI